MPSMVAGSAARMSTVWTLEPKLSLWARHAENPNMAGESVLSCRVIWYLLYSLRAYRGVRYTLLDKSPEQPTSASLRLVL